MKSTKFCLVVTLTGANICEMLAPPKATTLLQPKTCDMSFSESSAKC